MRITAILFLLLGPCALAQAVPEGVPRDLARERAAAVADPRYRVQFTLAPNAATAPGRAEIRFRLKTAAPLLLDYRDGKVNKVEVNGREAAINLENGHIVLPAATLRPGQNTVAIDFMSAIAPAGKPLIRYEDRDDGTEYIYTLFVPMDASMAFPCFDQPDLKGRFHLSVTAPSNWTVVSNTETQSAEQAGTGQRQTTFAETEPISTYLFAFAAGPFRKIEQPGMPGLYVRQSKLERARTEAVEVQQVAAQGIKYLADFFAQPFPFPKYDMVLIPGLAYGGMEHAGATFLREESVLFRTAPTRTDLLGRDLLVLHELTHQWFGDFTTMRWFDDLWLKEGFAQYMAYQTLATLKPDENIWKRFYEAIKPAAYAIDSTNGTTPIYQEIPNLKDAKSAYGAIVYSKAPGVLKQLAFVLGDEHFRDGLRLYLKEHAYGNAEWDDLVRAFERVSGRSLTRWADMWIRHRSMPQVDVRWSCAQGRVSDFSVSQHDVLGEGGVWPIAMQVLLSGEQPVHMRFELDKPQATLREALGKPCPAYVFANDQDYAYGRFLLDRASTGWVLPNLGDVRDLFRRTLLWGSLWESVRQAELAPADYLAETTRLLPAETDESLIQSLIAHVTTALHRYVGDQTRHRFVPQIEQMSADRMLHAPEQGQRIIWFRGLRALAESPSGRTQLKKLLDGTLAVPGVQLRPLDRWNMVAALIAMNDPDAAKIFSAERQRDHTGDGLKYAYMAEAARPDPPTKQRYFNDYLHDPSRPEDWVEQSLGPFNYWNQSQLTAPYLGPALEALPQVKRERKIFFLMSWLTAFIDGQQSAAADQRVHDYLRTAPLDKDLRLKVLQAVDELDRTVRIRQRYATP